MLFRSQAVWDEIGSGKPFLHVSGMYGTERGCLAMVYPLGLHPTNRNELIVWDLSEDPAQLIGLDAATVRSRLFARADELPEGVGRLPIKTIHVNKSPVVIGQLRTLQPAQAERWGLDVAACEARVPAAQAAALAMAALWPEVFQRPAPERAPDVDEDLYGGFLSPTDRQRLDRLRRAPEPDALRRASFDDPRLDELVFRWRARNWPETLDTSEQQRWQQWRAAALHEGLGGGLTLAAYTDKIDQLFEDADERAQGLLEALVDWGEQIAPPPP